MYEQVIHLTASLFGPDTWRQLNRETYFFRFPDIDTKGKNNLVIAIEIGSGVIFIDNHYRVQDAGITGNFWKGFYCLGIAALGQQPKNNKENHGLGFIKVLHDANLNILNLHK